MIGIAKKLFPILLKKCQEGLFIAYNLNKWRYCLIAFYIHFPNGVDIEETGVIN